MRDIKYGPALDKNALLEIRHNNSKIYTGTIQKLIGQDALFPIIDWQLQKINITPEENIVKLFSIERTSGQIFKFKKNIDHMSINDLKMERCSFIDYDFISAIKIHDKEIFSEGADSLVRGRAFYIY